MEKSSYHYYKFYEEKSLSKLFLLTLKPLNPTSLHRQSPSTINKFLSPVRIIDLRIDYPYQSPFDRCFQTGYAWVHILFSVPWPIALWSVLEFWYSLFEKQHRSTRKTRFLSYYHLQFALLSARFGENHAHIGPGSDWVREWINKNPEQATVSPS